MSGFLLDTHAVIWYLDDSPLLSPAAKEAIGNPENTIFICSASLWEIAIKTSLRRLDLGVPLGEFLSSIAASDFTVLQIEDAYLEEFVKLPPIHKDPFDRLIISTALFEELAIITIDENILKYDVASFF